MPLRDPSARGLTANPPLPANPGQNFIVGVFFCERAWRFDLPNRPLIWLLVAIMLWLGAADALALGQPRYVENVERRGSFRLAYGGAAAVIWVDAGEFAGVARAAADLQADVARVTGVRPSLTRGEASEGRDVVIVGTVGKNGVIDRLVRERKLDVSSIAGRWESFLIAVLPHPLPGVANALVIAGSDKRGTIYGIYDLSEQIGVSPWYWWADVPVGRRDALFIKPGTYQEGPPAVKYRGIFLNDEAPALSGWAREKFGGYNREFYVHVFELLLRLKANYLWPAMWGNCFNEDDPLNPRLADEYGIVMGTSHVEPMLRADKEWNRRGHTAQEWNYATNPEALRTFWEEGIERNKNYESIVTLAMRGKIDTPMASMGGMPANIALLERIVADQREIIARRLNPDLSKTPQVWALYKEVQEYYEKGMRVPDDVTLLWCDDNWGNLRRLPTPEERKRGGGAGVYYHFDYVGGPRNYKWINTNPIPKVWEQMNLALASGADRVWIVNVGDLKPMEFPLEFFLNLAWNPARWPKERLGDYTRLWAEREFGPAHAREIADIISKAAKYNGRRKPELLEPSTFSLVDYQEADQMVADWRALTLAADRVSRELPENARDAFFELVEHPAAAPSVVNQLYVAVAQNRLRASQGAASANDYAKQARALFEADQRLSDTYNHRVADGKWNHMMDQTHIGYTYWQEPRSNSLPRLTEIEIPAGAKLGVTVEGSTAAWPGSGEPPTLPTFDGFNQPRRWIDVFRRGASPFDFTVTASAPWIVVSSTNGAVEKDQRLWVSVDWRQAPKGLAAGIVRVSGAGESVAVSVNAFNPVAPARESVEGFVEADGYVSIEAEHFTGRTDVNGVRWEKIDDYGRTLSGMMIVPALAPSVTPPQNSPHLDYRMYLFDAGEIEVEAIIGPTLNFVPGRGLRFAISFDDAAPQIIDAVPSRNTVRDNNRDWETSVKDNARKLKSTHLIAAPGYHTLKFWMVDPAVTLEKLIVNCGGVKPSYLGPPESFHVIKARP